MEYKEYGCMFLHKTFTLFISISEIKITVSYANKFVFVTTVTLKIFNFYNSVYFGSKGMMPIFTNYMNTKRKSGKCNVIRLKRNIDSKYAIK